MAYLTQIGTTTTSNTSLVAATLVHTQTNTTRIRKLWISVFIDQVTGGGDYIAHVTIQRAGAGSVYTSIKTTLALAAAVTSGYFGTIPITLNATDVLKVYVIGLATDTTTPDVIVDVNEEWANIDANGRVDLGAILGSAITGTAARITAAFTKWFDVATPTGTVNSLPDVVPGLSGGLPILNAQLEVPKVKALTDAPPNEAGVTTILADYARRTGDYSTLAAGAQMDLVNVPNVTAVTAIQSGLATLAKLLKYVQLLVRKDAAIATDNATELAAINASGGSGAGTFANTTDAEEAIRDRGDAAWITAGGTGGSLPLLYTLTSSVGGAVIQGATVELYGNALMTGDPIATKTTNALGQVTFDNLIAGTYYLKCIKSGYETSTDQETVA